MTWTKLRGALYSQGTALYRITPVVYPLTTVFLLDSWCDGFGGWAMLATAGSLEEVQLFAQCEEVYCGSTAA